jgi:uncharacterized protein YkwD
MIGILITLGAGLAVAMAPPQPARPAQAPELHAIEARVIEKTNSQRIRHGLPPLAVDPALLRSARQHAAWMTNSRNLVHTNQPVAENIAMGQNSSAEVISDWMSSSGHRANILNPAHKRIGVASYVTPSGTIYWCQQFLH